MKELNEFTHIVPIKILFTDIHKPSLLSLKETKIFVLDFRPVKQRNLRKKVVRMTCPIHVCWKFSFSFQH